MLIATGFFDSRKNPSIKLKISGTFGGGVEFDAIIDTGFTGFICMPVIKAFPLGLPLMGSTALTLADGKTINRMIALGKVALGPKTSAGVVILEETGSDILVGMDLLRTFGIVLNIGSKSIMLMDEVLVDKFSEELVNKVSAGLKAPNLKDLTKPIARPPALPQDTSQQPAADGSDAPAG